MQKLVLPSNHSLISKIKIKSFCIRRSPKGLQYSNWNDTSKKTWKTWHRRDKLRNFQKLSSKSPTVFSSELHKFFTQIIIHRRSSSTSGPILILKYINDLPDITSNLSITLFADDTDVILSGKNLPFLTSQINNKLNLLKDWAIQIKTTSPWIRTRLNLCCFQINWLILMMFSWILVKI